MSVNAVELIEGLLLNALGKLNAGLIVAPGGEEGPSEQWRIGFRAGREAGEAAAYVLALSILTGQSPKTIADNLGFEADMARVFPVTLHVEAA